MFLSPYLPSSVAWFNSPLHRHPIGPIFRWITKPIKRKRSGGRSRRTSWLSGHRLNGRREPNEEARRHLTPRRLATTSSSSSPFFFTQDAERRKGMEGFRDGGLGLLTRKSVCVFISEKKTSIDVKGWFTRKSLLCISFAKAVRSWIYRHDYDYSMPDCYQMITSSFSPADRPSRPLLKKKERREKQQTQKRAFKYSIYDGNIYSLLFPPQRNVFALEYFKVLLKWSDASVVSDVNSFLCVGEHQMESELRRTRSISLLIHDRINLKSIGVNNRFERKRRRQKKGESWIDSTSRLIEDGEFPSENLLFLGWFAVTHWQEDVTHHHNVIDKVWEWGKTKELVNRQR